MATENEKLCMAIINNSKVENIDWKGVAVDLGLKINSAQKRWNRFKSAKFSASPRSPKAARPPALEMTTTKGDNVTGKKRSIQEMSDGEEDEVRQLPARKAKERKTNVKTPGSDEDGEEDGKWAGEESETDNGVSRGKKDYTYDGDSDGSAFEA